MFVAAGNYLILAKTAISNIPTSAITGDVGLSPAATSFITGFSITNATGYATSAQVTGKLFAADMAPPTPINLTTAVEKYDYRLQQMQAGRPTPDFSETCNRKHWCELTLVPGLYKWTNTVTLPSNVYHFWWFG
ncbi:MAG: ice-binding family protein [Cytophagales bacterium]|nr:ice-binding family protein [Cytophagales bacterium]